MPRRKADWLRLGLTIAAGLLNVPVALGLLMHLIVVAGDKGFVDHPSLLLAALIAFGGGMAYLLSLMWLLLPPRPSSRLAATCSLVYPLYLCGMWFYILLPNMATGLRSDIWHLFHPEMLAQYAAVGLPAVSSALIAIWWRRLAGPPSSSTSPPHPAGSAP